MKNNKNNHLVYLAWIIHGISTASTYLIHFQRLEKIFRLQNISIFFQPKNLHNSLRINKLSTLATKSHELSSLGRYQIRIVRVVLRTFRFITPLLLVCSKLSGQVATPNGEKSIDKLAEFSLLELMDIVVTSSAKRPEPLVNASSAIYAITQEDIQRSGATNIPEILRMVPGLEVARIDANKWAISARGFNDRFANKLLVLIDGRSVYTPTFSGVRWNAQDLLLEDVERIEVIRGPGATLWGVNAVNGVINIITKTAKNTQGGLIVGGAGSEEKGFAGFRYGAGLGKNAHFRIYTKYFDRDNFVGTTNKQANDQWDKRQGGIRFDWTLDHRNSITIQGDLFDDSTGQTYTFPSRDPALSHSITYNDTTDSSGGNLISRWEHWISDSADFTLQIYYDRFKRTDTLFQEATDTIDVDFQNRFTLGEQHQFIWGLGYRFIHDDFNNSFVLSFDPEESDTHFYSGFFQDTITVISDRFQIIPGSKIEHNYHTGIEFQPSLRLLASLSERQTLWGAISRAVRTPSRVEIDGRVNNQFIPPGTPQNPSNQLALAALTANPDFESEELLAYELGYRIQQSEQASLDIAVFYNVYENLRTFERDDTKAFTETVDSSTYLVIPALVDNKLDGETYGLEFVANWALNDHWRMTATYTYLKMQLAVDSGSQDRLAEDAEGDSPQQQISVLSTLKLNRDLEMDIWFRFVDNLSNLNIEQYTTMDIQLTWKPTPNLELSIVGQNLLDSNHPEFTSRFINSLPTEAQRSVYGKIVCHF